MTQPPVELKVLTYNLWGIFNSKMCQDRMAVFAEKIEHYDIILLQEQFDPSDFAKVQEMVPDHIRKARYFRRFPSGFYGSGCAVISKYPIHSAIFHTYPLQGYPEMILHGDFFANKGAACVKLDVPIERDGAIVNQEVILYTTHLVAIYQKVSQMSSWKKERYLPYRISQAIELASFIMNTSKPTDYVIIGGDFNSSQRSLEVQTMLILLKRRGYDLRSALPTPIALLETASTEEQAEEARSMFTFSPLNAFNASKTSYFKLLNMQSDIPSQIDHIFFNSAAFTLKPFEDCPHVNPSCPFQIDVARDGHKVPTGVVVFTKNEVVRTTARSLRQRCADRIRGQSSPTSYRGKIAGLVAVPVKEAAGGIAPKNHPTGPPFPEAEVTERFPMSDHYGVACRLQIKASLSHATNDNDSWQHVTSGPEPSLANAPSGVGAPVPLTEEEILVVNEVGKFLTFFVAKLRHQVTVTRIMTAVSLTLVGLNIWAVRRIAATQEQRTVVALRQVYQRAASVKAAMKSHRPSKPAAAERAAGVEVHFTEKLVDTTEKVIHKLSDWTNVAIGSVGIHIGSGGKPAVGKPPATATPTPAPAPASDVPKADETASATPDFVVLSRELNMRPIWASLGLSTIVTAVGSVVSVGGFLIGLFQRKGNANILEEQIRLLSPSHAREERQGKV